MVEQESGAPAGGGDEGGDFEMDMDMLLEMILASSPDAQMGDCAPSSTPAAELPFVRRCRW